MTSTNIVATRKPGRKSETPVQRLARLERDVLTAKHAVRDAENRGHATIGAAVREEAKGNAEFKATLHDILRRRVTTRAGKVEIALVLVE
jgi:hypothetical protein